MIAVAVVALCLSDTRIGHIGDFYLTHSAGYWSRYMYEQSCAVTLGIELDRVDRTSTHPMREKFRLRRRMFLMSLSRMPFACGGVLFI